MLRIVCFDLETRLWAKDLCPEDESYGWDLIREGKGGASAIGVYDTLTGWCHTYDDHSALAAARHIESADYLVSFRGEGFDVPVIEGLIGRRLAIKHHLDIYRDLAQVNAERGLVGTKGDFTLDAISRRNLGRGKINHGANAKELARRGHYGALFNYCLDDVRLTFDLFVKMCRDGGLINLGGGFVSLPVPDYIAREMAKE